MFLHLQKSSTVIIHRKSDTIVYYCKCKLRKTNGFPLKNIKEKAVYDTYIIIYYPEAIQNVNIFTKLIFHSMHRHWNFYVIWPARGKCGRSLAFLYIPVLLGCTWDKEEILEYLNQTVRWIWNRSCNTWDSLIGLSNPLNYSFSHIIHINMLYS